MRNPYDLIRGYGAEMVSTFANNHDAFHEWLASNVLRLMEDNDYWLQWKVGEVAGNPNQTDSLWVAAEPAKHGKGYNTSTWENAIFGAPYDEMQAGSGQHAVAYRLGSVVMIGTLSKGHDFLRRADVMGLPAHDGRYLAVGMRRGKKPPKIVLGTAEQNGRLIVPHKTEVLSYTNIVPPGLQRV